MDDNKPLPTPDNPVPPVYSMNSVMADYNRWRRENGLAMLPAQGSKRVRSLYVSDDAWNRLSEIAHTMPGINSISRLIQLIGDGIIQVRLNPDLTLSTSTEEGPQS